MPQYLTVDETAKYIRRSTGAVRNLVLRRKIPFRKVAGRLLFVREDIDRWVSESGGISLQEVIGERSSAAL